MLVVAFIPVVVFGACLELDMHLNNLIHSASRVRS